jgi:hypothetical protein
VRILLVEDSPRVADAVGAALGARGVCDAVRTVRQVGYAWGLERSKRA